MSPAESLLADDQPLGPGTELTARRARDAFSAMVTSRQLDIAARRLKARDEGYYTIQSAGHERNVALGALLRPTDPCFLHYRSGALMVARARAHEPESDPVTDTLESFRASRADPASGGRHKVWGSPTTWVIPQTSTIASHLPKAVGTAVWLDRLRASVGPGAELPDDTIVCCSFGDASINHAAALSAFNAARYARRRGAGVPILFVCEDNERGISVDTPRRWVASMVEQMTHVTYLHAGTSLVDVWEATRTAIDRCRSSRAPVFLHLPTVRLWGHAGSDVETGYRELADIRADDARDPLVLVALELVRTGAATPAQLTEVVARIRRMVSQRTQDLPPASHLASANDVMAPIALDVDGAVRSAAVAHGSGARADAQPRGRSPQVSHPTYRTLAAHINMALRDAMTNQPGVVVFGQDVGRKGGVYGLTSGLQEEFGQTRVFDTLLDETTILGLAQGAGLLGLLPVPEIQYLSYLHTAIDQLRGEAASTPFFSAGRYHTPMVVRVASFAYQRGFGGHFHNDHAIGALREIPGIIIATPSRPEDAGPLLRGCLGLAAAHGHVVLYLEPIALYHQRDLHEEGDGGWLADHPPSDTALLPGELGIHGSANADAVVLTYGNGVWLSLRAARRLAAEDDLRVRTIDLRFLHPLPMAAIRREVATAPAVVVVDECRRSGGVADALVSQVISDGYHGLVEAVTALDSYVPLGPASELVLVAEDDIVNALRKVASA